MGVQPTVRGSRRVSNTVQVSSRDAFAPQVSNRKPHCKWAEEIFPRLLCRPPPQRTRTRTAGGRVEHALPADDNGHLHLPLPLLTGPVVVSLRIMLPERTSARVHLTAYYYLYYFHWLLYSPCQTFLSRSYLIFLLSSAAKNHLRKEKEESSRREKDLLPIHTRSPGTANAGLLSKKYLWRRRSSAVAR